MITNMIEEDNNVGARQRSDSMETDRGNPMENMPPMTNLESHLEMINAEGHAAMEIVENNNRSFESPPSLNNTKISFKNLGAIAGPAYEEVKELVNVQDVREGGILLDENEYVGRIIIIDDVHQHESARNVSSQSNLQETQKKRTARGSTMRLDDGTESKSNLRRSKRLESKH